MVRMEGRSIGVGGVEIGFGAMTGVREDGNRIVPTSFTLGIVTISLGNHASHLIMN